MTKVVVRVPVEIDDQFIEDLMVTIIEGGSNYWVDHISINHPDGNKSKTIAGSVWAAGALNKGGEITVFIKEEGDQYDFLPIAICKKMLVQGIQQWLTRHEKPLEALDNYDADDADAIFQYALFQKLVFG